LMFLDRDAHLADLGLLGRSLFRCENLHSALLDFLGFLWILSPGSRVINGLHGISAGKIFSRPLPPGHWKRRNDGR
jgi:hypothetical protein